MRPGAWWKQKQTLARRRIAHPAGERSERESKKRFPLQRPATVTLRRTETEMEMGTAPMPMPMLTKAPTVAVAVVVMLTVEVMARVEGVVEGVAGDEGGGVVGDEGGGEDEAGAEAAVVAVVVASRMMSMQRQEQHLRCLTQTPCESRHRSTRRR